MIPDLLIGLIFAVLTALLSLAPPWSLPAETVTSGSEIGDYLAALNFYFPVADVLAGVLALLAFSAALTVWHLVMFVYDKIPLKAT